MLYISSERKPATMGVNLRRVDVLMPEDRLDSSQLGIVL